MSPIDLIAAAKAHPVQVAGFAIVWGVFCFIMGDTWAEICRINRNIDEEAEHARNKTQDRARV